MLFSGSCGQQSLKKKIAKKINTGIDNQTRKKTAIKKKYQSIKNWKSFI